MNQNESDMMLLEQEIKSLKARLEDSEILVDTWKEKYENVSQTLKYKEKLEAKNDESNDYDTETNVLIYFSSLMIF